MGENGLLLKNREFALRRENGLSFINRTCSLGRKGSTL